MQDRLPIAEDAWDKARPRDISDSAMFDQSSVGCLESARDGAIALILEGNPCEAIQARAIEAISEAVRSALKISLSDEDAGAFALASR
jgi:hypothetical protein